MTSGAEYLWCDGSAADLTLQTESRLELHQEPVAEHSRLDGLLF